MLNLGYIEHSMSVRAYNAYEDGEKPLSKWTKKAVIDNVKKYASENNLHINLDKLNKISKKILFKKFLCYCGWHHTSKFFNETEFYGIDEDFVEELTDEKIDNLLILTKQEKQKKQEDVKPVFYKVKYTKWVPNNFGKKVPVDVIDFGEIKGNWFYTSEGTKKNIHSNGFEKIQEITKRQVTINRKKVLELEKLFTYQKKYKKLDKFIYRVLTEDIPKEYVKQLKQLKNESEEN